APHRSPIWLLWPGRSPDPVGGRRGESIWLGGDLPSPANPPAACRFHTRCPYVQPTRCREEVPFLRKLATGHEVACHWAEEIQAGRLTPHEREPVLVAPPVVLAPGEEPTPD